MKKLTDYKVNFLDNIGEVFNADCIELMKKMPANSIDLLLTDIPYGQVNKTSHGLRNLDKGMADKITFELSTFLPLVDKITKGSGYIFCGQEQVSQIVKFFRDRKYTTRFMVWEKSNPSPMNCQHTWMNGLECFVYFKKKGATFNYFYKSNVVKFPNGKSKVHPTQKPIALFKYLIEASSNKNDIVFDPCLGAGTTLFASSILDRRFIGAEIDTSFCEYIDKHNVKQTKIW